MTDRQADRQTDRRNYTLDYARAIGVMLVIFGHETTYPRDYIRDMIYSFHMPLFFILSGIVFIEYTKFEESIKIFIKRKIRSILLPALFFEILMYIWKIIKCLIESDLTIDWLASHALGILLQIQDSVFAGSL